MPIRVWKSLGGLARNWKVGPSCKRIQPRASRRSGLGGM